MAGAANRMPAHQVPRRTRWEDAVGAGGWKKVGDGSGRVRRGGHVHDSGGKPRPAVVVRSAARTRHTPPRHAPRNARRRAPSVNHQDDRRGTERWKVVDVKACKGTTQRPGPWRERGRAHQDTERESTGGIVGTTARRPAGGAQPLHQESDVAQPRFTSGCKGCAALRV